MIFNGDGVQVALPEASAFGPHVTRRRQTFHRSFETAWAET